MSLSGYAGMPHEHTGRSHHLAILEIGTSNGGSTGNVVSAPSRGGNGNLVGFIPTSVTQRLANRCDGPSDQGGDDGLWNL